MSNHKFEPQCTEQWQLFAEYSRVLKMCKEAGFNRPWECVKCGGGVCVNALVAAMQFNQPPAHYEFAIAIVEGKPVFRGDVLYPRLGQQKTFIPVGLDAHGNPFSDEGWHYHVDGLSWNPPQRTIEINGVKVKEPVSSHIVHCLENNRDISHYEVRVRIEIEADAEAFKAAMEGKK